MWRFSRHQVTILVLALKQKTILVRSVAERGQNQTHRSLNRHPFEAAAMSSQTQV